MRSFPLKPIGKTVITRVVEAALVMTGFQQQLDKQMGDLKEFVEKAPMMDELSSSKTDFWREYGIQEYNPDELVTKKGMTVLHKMRHDDQIKAVSATKKYARLSTPWKIHPASESVEDGKIAQFVRFNLENMEGSLNADLLEILTAMDFGYSITEKVWKIINKGEFKGKIGLKALKTRRPDNFDFDVDEHDNLKPNGVVQGLRAGTAKYFPKEKFIIYSHGKEFDNFYGSSDLRAVYRSYWSKDILIRFWNMWLERFPAPFIIGWYPEGTSSTRRTNLLNILKRLQIATAAILPDNLEVEIKEMKDVGHAVFKEAITFHNTSMARGILCPDLIGYTETTGPGSYALGKKHFDVFLFVLEQLGKELEETVMLEQLIKQLVDYNYDVDLYPQFKFETLREEDMEARAKIVDILIKAGLIDPTESWVRDYLSLPAKGQKFSEFEEYGTHQSKDVITITSDVPDPKDLDDDEDDKEDIQEALDKLKKDSNLVSAGRSGLGWGFISGGKEEDAYRALTEYEEAAGYDPITFAQDQEEWLVISRNAMSEGVLGMLDSIVDQVRRLKVLNGDPNYRDIEKIQLNPRVIRDAVFHALLEGYFRGKADALSEVETALGHKVKFEAANFAADDFLTRPPKESLKRWLKKVPVKPGEFKAMTDRQRARAFSIAGIIEKDVLSSMQEILQKAMTPPAWTLDQFNQVLHERSIEYTGSAYRRDRTGELITAYHAETILRTNYSEVYNLGRKALYEDPDVRDFVPAYQFSAILDSRTRPNHADMDGRVFERGDPIWARWWPPVGYNCRCTVIPVTSNQEYSVSTSPDANPDPGFGGVMDEPTFKRTPRQARKPLPIPEVWSPVITDHGTKKIDQFPTDTVLDEYRNMEWKHFSIDGQTDVFIEVDPNWFPQGYLAPEVKADILNSVMQGRLKTITDAMQALPVEDRYLAKEILVMDKKSPFKSHSPTVAGWAEYGRGRIALVRGYGAFLKGKGIIIHEVGHLKAERMFGSTSITGVAVSPIPETYRRALGDVKFKKVHKQYLFSKGWVDGLTQSQKNVSWYGTFKADPDGSKGPNEAFSEAYSKYYSIGKVTEAGSATKIHEFADDWFRKNMSAPQPPSKRGNSKWLLNLEEEVI
jgi:SPP1 gp7 family putative phage head morphogenesis protein